ncbi:MAG: cupin domain-containing protein, partial [Ignavibacteria bacterium]
RIKAPAGFKIAPHWHPGVEHVTVISGTFYLGHGEKFDEMMGTALTAGSLAIMQPKTAHFAFAKEETVVQLHGLGPWEIVYVNPEDDPANKK